MKIKKNQCPQQEQWQVLAPANLLPPGGVGVVLYAMYCIYLPLPNSSSAHSVLPLLWSVWFLYTASLKQFGQFFAVWVNKVCWLLSILILCLCAGSRRQQVSNEGYRALLTK